MKLNLANFLTLLRIAAIPVVVICFYSPLEYARPIAGVLFGLAAITDMIDGWVARRFGQMSRFGEFLDPVADKLMVAIVLVMLVQAQSSWFEDVIAMIIIGREITISALREWMSELGERGTVKVGLLGKLKTIFQMTAISLLLFKTDLLGLPLMVIGEILLYLAAGLTLWSMWTYMHSAWPVMSQEDSVEAAGETPPG